jgi:lipoprotein signal peptidase
MALWVYFVLFVSVIAADQLSKGWATRVTAAAEAATPAIGRALTRSRLEGLGVGIAIVVWLVVGGAGAWLCATTSGGASAALGGIAAWAAAASNLGEWLVRGQVVDWLRVWPRSSTNFADVVLIAGAAQLMIWMAVS